jgi:hypothetical protein
VSCNGFGRRGVPKFVCHERHNDQLFSNLAQSMILPRFIRFRDAPNYLGMDKDRFNAEVRPYLIEIPIGTQGIAFDRLDLDAWADQYRDREGRPGAKVEKEIAQWDGPKRQDSSVTQVRASGRLTSGSEDMAAFTKALAVVTSKKRNVTSTAG